MAPIRAACTLIHGSPTDALEASRLYVEEVSRNSEQVESRCLRLHAGFRRWLRHVTHNCCLNMPRSSATLNHHRQVRAQASVSEFHAEPHLQVEDEVCIFQVSLICNQRRVASIGQGTGCALCDIQAECRTRLKVVVFSCRRWRVGARTCWRTSGPRTGPLTAACVVETRLLRPFVRAVMLRAFAAGIRMFGLVFDCCRQDDAAEHVRLAFVPTVELMTTGRQLGRAHTPALFLLSCCA